MQHRVTWQAKKVINEKVLIFYLIFLLWGVKDAYELEVRTNFLTFKYWRDLPYNSLSNNLYICNGFIRNNILHLIIPYMFFLLKPLK